MISRAIPLAARFWNKVDKTLGYGPQGQCWVWIAGTNGSGYGTIGEWNPSRKRNQMKDAHRVSWEIHNGSIPDGLCVLHHCDNPPCVNPAHLFLGTKKTNSKDMVKKGRCNSGGNGAVLNVDQVKAIRAAYSAERVTMAALARRYGVSNTTVNDILHNRSWHSILL